MIAASLMGNNVKISNVIPEHLDALLLKLKEIGIKIEVGNDYFIISKSDNMKSVNIKTLPYPGFPTDLQQPITTLLTQCEGSSKVEETIYENRFLNVDYLNKMGSNIKTKDKEAIVYGVTPLKGCEVIATDLRAGACLVLAALIAEGKTTIHNIDHILRGYEGIVEKLNGLGAKIKIV